MLVELHTHTHYSKQKKVPVEGLNSPEEMVRHAKKIGLGAIAITDHDQIKGALEARKHEKKYGVVVITGEEVTTEKGHILALGVSDFIKPGLSVQETIDIVHSQGGIAVGDHPFDIKNDGIKEYAKLTDAIEVFNAINMERVSNRRSKKFATLWKKPQVAGSDAHCIEMLGYGVNEISADTEESILKAIKNGRVEIRARYIPSSVIMRWSVKRLQMSYPFVMNYINTNYSTPKRFLSNKMLGLVKRSPGSIDYLFKTLGYISLGSVIIYSIAKNSFQ